MYDFNKQVHEESRSGIPRQGIYRDNVKFTRMTPKNEGSDIMFKFLPAFNPATAQEQPDGSITVDMASQVTFRDAAGNFTPWGRYIQTFPFTGHGKSGKGSGRRELVSLKSFSSDPGVYDPVTALVDMINSDPLWKYLTEDTLAPESTPKKPVITEKKCINARPNIKLIANIVDVRKPAPDVELGEFSTSVLDSLFAEGTGLAVAPNISATEDMIAQNPMAAWYVGDMTAIGQAGPVFRILKDPDASRGSFTGYVVQIATSAQGRPYRFNVDPQLLLRRYNLFDLASIIKKPTEEELVRTLVSLFNQWHPNRQYHEFELLKACFGHNFEIPEPPSRGMGVGFGQNPATAPQPAQQRAAPVDPQRALQAPVPGLPQQMQPPAQQAAIEGPGEDDLQYEELPQAPAPQPAVVPQAKPPVQQAQTPPQASAALSQQQQHAPIPGEPVPRFNRDQFLNEVRSTKKK